MFVISVRKKYGMLIANDSLTILIKSKGKGEFRMAYILVLPILENRKRKRNPRVHEDVSTDSEVELGQTQKQWVVAVSVSFIKEGERHYKINTVTL
jgi:hypothetical protein